MIHRQSFTPIYIQIAQTIAQSVDDGALGCRSQMPSERELAECHIINRLTAHQVILESYAGASVTFPFEALCQSRLEAYVSWIKG